MQWTYADAGEADLPRGCGARALALATGRTWHWADGYLRGYGQADDTLLVSSDVMRAAMRGLRLALFSRTYLRDVRGVRFLAERLFFRDASKYSVSCIGGLQMEIGWIAAIVVGGIAGWLAEQFMKSDMGLVMNIVLGIVGAALASWLFSLIGISFGPGWVGYLIAGFIGAVILIFAVRMVRQRA
jgi:uncharacterized membrane protein YeaQ/YmgE (transglycosylase-associated protein family)